MYRKIQAVTRPFRTKVMSCRLLYSNNTLGTYFEDKSSLQALKTLSIPMKTMYQNRLILCKRAMDKIFGDL